MNVSIKQVRELDALTRALLETAKAAACPDDALNALLTAYLNVAHASGVLHQVPGVLMTVAQHPYVVQACEAQMATPPSIH